MDVTLLKVTAAIYLFATGTFIADLVFPKDSFSRLSPLLVLGGFLIHTAAFTYSCIYGSYPTLTELRDAISFYSWLMVGVYLLVQLKYRLTILGCFIAPLAFIMSLAAFTLSTGSEAIPPAIRTYWLPIHVTLALSGNAVFALAFGVGVLYLLEEYQLKRKKMAVLHTRLPSLETLDRLNYVFLVWGFPLMTLGIITGSIQAHLHWGDYWSWDPRQITSAMTWLLYGVLLHGRITVGWRGKKAAIWTIVGFTVVLGYFFWGDVLFPTRHGGRFE
ncbi:MAG: cytochrome c biogenesis protein CcsA [Deltaproteobacteria bacterium]|nr:cytochrome c biogenesis protein CcsA [Deltaproteobacteria bacterium]